jgi:signal recognition particle receptor subunit beta
MANVPVLVLANKQDLMNALPADEVSSRDFRSSSLSSLFPSHGAVDRTVVDAAVVKWTGHVIC